MYPMNRDAGVEDPLVTARQDMLLEQKSILSEIMEPDNIDVNITKSYQHREIYWQIYI